MLRFLTAGESHGKALVTILEGMPAGLAIDFDAITSELRRRQGGYGRGRRMAIESDRADVLSGVRHGMTTGAPIALHDPEQGLGKLAADHARGARAAGGRVRRRSPRRHAAPPGPRRPGRRREVRPRRHPQRPRARQRPRDGGASGDRRARPAAAGGCRHADREPRVRDRIASRSTIRWPSRSRTPAISAPMPRFTAPMRTSNAR